MARFRYVIMCPIEVWKDLFPFISVCVFIFSRKDPVIVCDARHPIFLTGLIKLFVKRFASCTRASSDSVGFTRGLSKIFLPCSCTPQQTHPIILFFKEKMCNKYCITSHCICIMCIINIIIKARFFVLQWYLKKKKKVWYFTIKKASVVSTILYIDIVWYENCMWI